MTDPNPFQGSSVDRFRATLEHINHMKALEKYVQDSKLREAYLISVLKSVQFEEQETGCLTSHCRDLVNQALESCKNREDLQRDLEHVWGLLKSIESARSTQVTVFEIQKLLEKYRGTK